MKTVKYFFLYLFFAAGFSFAQEFPLVTIMDIQYLPDSIISQGDHPSLMNGDTVRVRGVVMVRPVVDPVTDRRRVIAAGSRWSIFIQDESGAVWGGINALQHDTTGPNQNTFLDLVDTAQIVEFTGYVEEFFTTTQLALLINPAVPVQVVGQLDKRPDPIELTIADFESDGALNFFAEKYEGMYVIIRNVFTSDRNTASGTFTINDGLGNKMYMYDQSGFFTKRVHRLTDITDYEPPVDGTTLSHIRGVINTRTDGYYITPLYPGDIAVSATPPTITTVRRNIGVVQPNQNVTITANIIDLDGTVEEAKIYYRVNGGTYQSADMASVGGNTPERYSGIIPGVSGDSSLVDFFIWARDNHNNTTTNPGDTTRNKYFYPVLNRPLTIQDVTYSPYGGGFSGFNNYRVTVSGIVTADTSDIPGFGSIGPRVYIQNGEGPWSGILLLGFTALPLKQGDHVTVSGTVIESFSVTSIDSLTQVVVNSSSNPVPAPQVVTTGEIGGKTSGTVQAEKWESVLVDFVNITVTDENADGSAGPDTPGGSRNFGEIFINDGSGDLRVELQEGNHNYHNFWDENVINQPGMIYITEGSTFEGMAGVMYYSFGNYKLVPRKNDDFRGFISDIEEIDVQPSAFTLMQNYPNPFNPSTTIAYSIPEAAFVSIKIYNVLGQEVKSLINYEQSAGTYKVIFDARDLTSGLYIYQIQAGKYNEVKKMMLLK